QVLAELRELVPLAPLHQPYNLGAIDALNERMPGVPQVACFDTGFPRGRAAIAELVPLPAEIRSQGVQRYGFHGLSYEYIASVLPETAPQLAAGRGIVAPLGRGAGLCALRAPPPRLAAGRVLAAHRASGASLCALRAGKSIDSSLGFTALDGLCMG